RGRRSDQRRTGGGRQGLGGRHDRDRHARERRGRNGLHPGRQRRDQAVHPAGLHLPGGGSTHHELPPATLHAAHAGRRIRWIRASDARIPRRRRGALPLLLLRRRDGDPLMFEYRLDARDGAARAGTFTLPHGVVQTPAFMPVGTQGSVKTISRDELTDEIRAQIILANTYHLYLRPGHDVVQQLGGLHAFTGWNKPFLTDSGGFEVFSLETMRKITEEGVEFTSHTDGSRHMFTPEKVMEIQRALGADVIMAFDECPPGQSSRALAEEAHERTLRWLERCRDRFLA